MVGTAQAEQVMGRRAIGLRVATVLTGIFLAAAPAGAQSLSDHLTDMISRARANSLQQRFGRFLVDQGRDLALDPGAGIDEARRTLLRRAAVYENIREYALAEASLTQALQMAPPAGALYAARGYFYMRRGRFSDALADFVIGARVEPGDARLTYAGGRAQSALGDYAAAITYYDEAIRLAPRDPTFYLARAEARIHLDQPGSARDDYDRALATRVLRPTDRYFAFLGRGYAFLMQSDYPGAIADFDSALAVDPGSLNALMWRGYAHEKAGQVALALDDYERAVAVEPGDRMARNNLQRLRSN
jgi:tetratricopeptide (TPR) repeat protein